MAVREGVSHLRRWDLHCRLTGRDFVAKASSPLFSEVGIRITKQVLAKTELRKEVRLTSKGRITVPHEVRRALGVRAGDKLLFELDGAEFCIKPVRTTNPFEKYRGVGNPGIPSGRKAILQHIRRFRSSPTQSSR
jgi:AbrB family looped-hinge helix DNA binding protein